MPTFVSLLRGINVSGKNLIKMDVLRQIYSDSGFLDVKTYLQSGNVIFSTEGRKKEELADIISKNIAETTGIQTKIFVFTREEWVHIAQENPFSNADESCLYVTLLDGPIDDTFQEKFMAKTVKGEKLFIAGDRIYTCYPEGYGTSKLDNNAIESVTRRAATTRNRKTVNALRDMLNG